MILLCLLVLYSRVATAATPPPRVIVIVDSGVGWAQLGPHTHLPRGVALAGMGDPSTSRGETSVLLSLGACGRNVGLESLTPVPKLRLQRAGRGQWRIPRTLWERVCDVNAAAHAGGTPGSLGSVLRAHCRVVLAGSPARAPFGALLAADPLGRVDGWLPSPNDWAHPSLAGAALFVAPERGRGLAVLNDMAQRFPDTPLLYLSVIPPPQPGGGSKRDLTPVIVRGQGTGLLYSRRTHWRGVVSAMDIAPTILALAQVPVTSGYLDSPLTVVPQTASLATMRQFTIRARASYWARNWMTGIWGVLAILGYLVLVLRPRPRSDVLVGWAFASWVMPVLLVLVLPAFWFLPLPLLIALLLAAWLAVALGLSRLPVPTAWALSATLGSAGLLFTVFTNAHFARQPFLGLDIITGHRFFGVGNETMGVLIGVLTMWMGWALTRWPRHGAVLICSVFGLAAAGLGLSCWGANWGGMMATALTGLLFLAVRYSRRMRWWHVPVAIAGVTLGGACLIALLTLLAPLVSSHADALGQSIVREGLPALWTMIARKLAFAWSSWHLRAGWAIVPGGLALAAILVRLRRSPHFLQAIPRSWWDATIVAWGGAVLAGLVNDSGVMLTGLIWLITALAAAVCTVLVSDFSRAEHAPSPQCALHDRD